MAGAYFIRPAAVSARVMTAPTSMVRRGFGCFGFGCGVGRCSSVVSGHSTFERSGTGADTGEADTGETAGISLALGEAAFGCCTRWVRPKKFAM